MLKDGEILKKVDKCPWMISNKGRIKSLKTNAEKIQYMGTSGYYFVSYNSKTYLTHRLVAQYFIDPIPKGMVVNHKDGNKTNNHVDNLEIVTYKENTRHAFDHGLMVPLCGEENSMSKLTNSQARNLINDIIKGLANGELAIKYNLHDRYISLVRHKKRWKKLWSEFGSINAEMSNGNDRNKSLSPQQFVQVVKKIKNGVSNASIEREFNLSSGTGSRIRHKKIYFNWWKDYFGESI
ncbi:HNH endonuclease signature motif containing protein [Paenibacillus chitinolyticus]|uniref:HNH endonuclease signature motif containing protein n=1 Tax=Paenibacillus chitinolyticus TaxID=79263 RepID=UPI003557EEA7